MKIGIILNTNDAETCWNCFRFGNEAISKNHSVKVFLLGKGVEIESVKDTIFPLLEGSIKKFRLFSHFRQVSLANFGIFLT